MKFVFLSFLFSVAFCGSWDTPIKISEGATTKALYIDSKASIIHIVWCQQIANTKDIFLFHKQIPLSGPPTEGKQLEGVRGCIDVVIDGSDDGKSIVVVFTGPRVSGSSECSEKRPEGCVDVFYKESKDGGLTWSLSIAVPRNDMKDAVNRITPQLMRIKESGRTWITYVKNDTSQDYPTLTYVTKPAGTDIFPKEASLMPGEKLLPSIAYTSIKANVQAIHLGWCQEEEGNYIGYYSKSLDLGKTWTQPAAIFKRAKAGQRMPKMKLASGKSAPGYIFMMYPDNLYTKWDLRWSHDHGATWSSETLALNYYNSISSALCTVTVKKPESELFLLSEIEDKGEFGVYSFGKRQYIKGETPFARTENKIDPAIACVSIPAKKYIEVKALVTGGETGKTLYFTTQDYEPII